MFPAPWDACMKASFTTKNFLWSGPCLVCSLKKHFRDMRPIHFRNNPSHHDSLFKPFTWPSFHLSPQMCFHSMGDVDSIKIILEKRISWLSLTIREYCQILSAYQLENTNTSAYHFWWENNQMLNIEFTNIWFWYLKYLKNLKIFSW